MVLHPQGRWGAFRYFLGIHSHLPSLKKTLWVVSSLGRKHTLFECQDVKNYLHWDLPFLSVRMWKITFIEIYPPFLSVSINGWVCLAGRGGGTIDASVSLVLVYARPPYFSVISHHTWGAFHLNHPSLWKITFQTPTYLRFTLFECQDVKNYLQTPTYLRFTLFECQDVKNYLQTPTYLRFTLFECQDVKNYLQTPTYLRFTLFECQDVKNYLSDTYLFEIYPFWVSGCKELPFRHLLTCNLPFLSVRMWKITLSLNLMDANAHPRNDWVPSHLPQITSFKNQSHWILPV